MMKNPTTVFCGLADGASGGRRLPHLRQLEAESIHILREVAAEFERPVMLMR